MDVRCERCRAQYVFDDEQVTPAGLTVQCTNCGHLFRVKKKELVVTVPVRPDDVRETPIPASAAANRTTSVGPAPALQEARDPSREWHVRQANGNIFTFRELTTLQKWIIEQKVARDDEISTSGEQWRRLGNIAELASFFQVVEAAERGRAQSQGSAITPKGAQAPVFGLPLPPPQGPYPPPPSGFPPPSFTMRPPPAPPATPQPAPPAAVRRPSPARPPPESVDVDLDDAELAVVRRGRAGWIVAAGVLLVAAGAAAWFLAPQLFVRKPPPPPPAPVVVAPPPEPPPPPEPSPAPVSPPEPVVEKAPEPPPAPVVAPPKPKGPKALLAQAARLRDKGDVEAALDLYGRVASDDPENVEALTGRGLCYLDLERYPPAEASFLAALQLAPRDLDALLGLAETYRWQGKKADAIKYYERVLAAGSGGEEAQVARSALEELRK